MATLTPCQMKSLLQEPLNYNSFGEYRSRHNNESVITCLIAGVLVFWVIMSLLKSSSTPTYARNNLNPLYYPSNVLTTSARMVRSVVGGIPKHSTLPTLDQCKWLKVPTNPASNKIVVADCKDWKSATADEMAKTDQQLRDFLDNNDDVIIMVYAPWCPHCHTEMPKFVNMAQNVKPKSKMLIVNAEMTRPSFSEDTKGHLFPLKQFPTFLHKTGGKVREVELLNLLQEYGGQGTSSKLVEEEFADGYDTESYDASSGDMLDKLF